MAEQPVVTSEVVIPWDLNIQSYFINLLEETPEGFITIDQLITSWFIPLCNKLQSLPSFRQYLSTSLSQTTTSPKPLQLHDLCPFKPAMPLFTRSSLELRVEWFFLLFPLLFSLFPSFPLFFPLDKTHSFLLLYGRSTCQRLQT